MLHNQKEGPLPSIPQMRVLLVIQDGATAEVWTGSSVTKGACYHARVPETPSIESTQWKEGTSASYPLMFTCDLWHTIDR